MNDNKDHYTSNYMVNFDDAIRLISTELESNPSELLPLETVSLNESSGRILAEPISSPISIPSFDNSAMDGYAVNYRELKDATPENPVVLNLIGLSAAGDGIASANITNNSAWKIMTGAPVPDGFDSIIPVENTELDSKKKQVTCFSSPANGAHVRSAGEDFVKGDAVFSARQLINANRIMALASLGISDLKVVAEPSIAIFSTGKELVDDPQVGLKPGQIRNSNMPYILDYLSHLPVAAYNAGTNYDDVEGYQSALQHELDKGTNIIISTGAVSMGDFDFIPQTILKMGGEIIFHKVKIRPGKPVLFAKFPNGSYYFGLPGNPISATIGLRFFVTHLLYLMIGLPAERPSKCRLKNAKSKKKGFRSILKANISSDENALLNAKILDGQESFKIHPLLDANGWLIIPEDRLQIEAGELAEFYSSQPDFNQ